MQDDKPNARANAAVVLTGDEDDSLDMAKNLTGKEAVLHYGTPDYVIVRAGAFVRCAVTGDQIPLARLRYWSPELQEPYANAEVASQRWQAVQDAREEPGETDE